MEPRPAEQPPIDQPLVAQPQVAKWPNFDLAEAAGFHRAMDIWSEVLRHGTFGGVRDDLRRQAAKLADLLAPYNIEDPSSLPHEFNRFRTPRCPNRLSHQEADPTRLLPQSSYYDEFLNILNRR